MFSWGIGGGRERIYLAEVALGDCEGELGAGADAADDDFVAVDAELVGRCVGPVEGIPGVVHGSGEGPLGGVAVVDAQHGISCVGGNAATARSIGLEIT